VAERAVSIGATSEQAIAYAADIISQAQRLVILTGAGISTESGIPDFRGEGGLWGTFNQSDLLFHKFLTDESSREKFWEFSKKIWRTIAVAQPNAGHHAIAELSHLGKLDCLITQNVDGLHQKSGIPQEKLIELHGTARIVSCLSCDKRYPREEIQLRLESGEKVPRCACGGLLKSLTVSFGQPVPKLKVQQAEMKSAQSDVFLVAGSSLSVYPAARFPLLAKESGARVIIINLTPTPHDRHADMVINEKIGKVLPIIVAQVRASLSCAKG
jgi:NAD-dependent deacetylase